MKVVICLLSLMLVPLPGGWNNLIKQQFPAKSISVSEQSALKSNIETAQETADEEDETWRKNALEIFDNEYLSAKASGEYALSNEDLANLNYDKDFDFDLSDLKYDVVKALVREIYEENHYTSYEFYEHTMDVDKASHQETGVEYFEVLFDNDQYWFIYYCQGKAYALFDDSDLIARSRKAKALSIPGEDVVFGFPFKDSPLWMVVCTKGINKDYLVCRIGNPEDKSILLEYPKNKDDSWSHFVYTIAYKDSKEKPQNGEVTFKTSLSCEDEKFVYTIVEDDIYQDEKYHQTINLQVLNKQSGAVNTYEGKGDMSDTVGSLSIRYISDQLKSVQQELK